jgi:hypothetical protein
VSGDPWSVGWGNARKVLKVHGIVHLCMCLFRDLHLRLYLHHRAHPFKSIKTLSPVCTRDQERFDLTRCCVHCSWIFGAGLGREGRFREKRANGLFGRQSFDWRERKRRGWEKDVSNVDIRVTSRSTSHIP